MCYDLHVNRIEYVDEVASRLVRVLGGQVNVVGGHVRGVQVPGQDMYLWVEAYKKKIAHAGHHDRFRVHLQPVYDEQPPISDSDGATLVLRAPKGVTFRNDPRPQRSDLTTSGFTWGHRLEPDDYQPQVRTACLSIELLLEGIGLSRRLPDIPSR